MGCKVKIIEGLLCAVSIASAQNTVTLGAFGYTHVEKPAGKLNIIGNNFVDTTLNDFAPAAQYNGDIAAGNADTMYIWSPSGETYQVCAVYDERPYVGATGTVEWRDFNNFTGSAVNPDIPSGSGMWLYSLGSVGDTTTVISGNIVVAQSVTNVVDAGYQQLSYPFSITVDLNDTMLADGATGDIAAGSADKIYSWDVGLQTYVVYALYDERPYLGPSGIVEWRYFNDFTSSASNTTIHVGNGFWYYAINGFDWTETNKYFNNL